jgi:hypothetical protein
MLNRPKTTNFEQQNTEYMALSLRSQRKSRELSLREKRSSTRKGSSSAKSNPKGQ